MGIVELFLVAAGLSMDAFAVSVCKGLGMRSLNWGQAAVIAAFFGLFQALMPVAGWLLGTQFSRFVEPVDHWIAFVLLGCIGAKMVWDGLHGSDEGQACPVDQRLDLGELVLLAVATSIDALAVGITFAFLGVDVAPAAALIGVVTFFLSLAGVGIGHAFGRRFERAATVAGGTALILIGFKILLEHLGVL